MKLPVYQRIADELAGFIEAGSLRPGERLPSVRGLSRQKRVSATSAVASLRDLERRGLIEARPQSGFFVRFRSGALAEPQAAPVPAPPRLVGTGAIVSRLLQAGVDETIAPLGTALPDPAWFPVRALQREVAAAARRHPQLLGRYAQELGGLPGLRREIVRHYAQVGCSLQEQEITITNGCMEAMNLALRACTQPGDTIAIESPTYFGVLQIAEALALKVIELPSHPRDGVSLEALEERLASAAGRTIRACMVIGNFNNPTGSLLSEARKKRLVEICRRARITLIEDDIYGDLQFAGPRPLPAKAFDRDGEVILCSSFSKSLAPGLRIGYICGGKLSDDIRMQKFIASAPPVPVAQQALVAVLRSGRYGRHLVGLRRRFADHVARMSTAVEAAFPAGTRLSRPQGGYVLWVELPGDIDTLALHERARREGVDFVPGQLFSAGGIAQDKERSKGRVHAAYRNCLRLNCGHQWSAQTERAVMRLGALVHRALDDAHV